MIRFNNVALAGGVVQHASGYGINGGVGFYTILPSDHNILYVVESDVEELLITGLQLAWSKQEIELKIIVPIPGQIDDFMAAVGTQQAGDLVSAADATLLRTVYDFNTGISDIPLAAGLWNNSEGVELLYPGGIKVPESSFFTNNVNGQRMAAFAVVGSHAFAGGNNLLLVGASYLCRYRGETQARRA